MFVGLAAWGGWSAFGPKPLRDAQAALDRRDFRTADDILTKHLTAHPDDAEARLLAARTARRAGDFDRAREHLNHYSRTNLPDEASELEANLLAAHTGNRATAERLFETHTGEPESPDTPAVMEAYIEGTLRAVAPHPGARIDLERDDPALVARLRTAVDVWLFFRRGVADRAQGFVWQGRIAEYAREHAKAVATFRAALALDPGHFEARLQLALALGPDAPDESVRHLEVLLKRKPDDRRLRFFVATGYRALGRSNDSRQLLEEVLKADPNDLNALVELARLNLDEGKIADAELLLQRALKVAPNAPEANVAMSRCQLLAGRPLEAERYRKRFEELEAQRTRGPVTP